MTLRYLLDTNVLSEPLRPRPSTKVLERLRRHDGEVAIASVVWHELRFGVARLPVGSRRAAIERYLAEVVAMTVPVLDYDRQAAEWHALERARLAASGKTPPFVDGQIAAVAQVNGLTLATANKTDFAMFKNLRVEHWI